MRVSNEFLVPEPARPAKLFFRHRALRHDFGKTTVETFINISPCSPLTKSSGAPIFLHSTLNSETPSTRPRPQCLSALPFAPPVVAPGQLLRAACLEPRVELQLIARSICGPCGDIARKPPKKLPLQRKRNTKSFTDMTDDER
jgi:hypothetical protein